MLYIIFIVVSCRGSHHKRKIPYSELCFGMDCTVHFSKVVIHQTDWKQQVSQHLKVWTMTGCISGMLF